MEQQWRLWPGLTLSGSSGCGGDNSESRAWAGHKPTGHGGCVRRVGRRQSTQVWTVDHHLLAKSKAKGMKLPAVRRYYPCWVLQLVSMPCPRRGWP